MNYTKTLKYIYFFLLFIKGLECLTPFSHGDAFSYHLIIAKHILSDGLQETLQNFFPTVIAGYFEFVYLIPISIFGNTYSGQVAAQLLHFILGLGLSSFLITRLIREEKIKWLGGIFALTLAKSPDMFLYAKNDGIIVTLALVLYYLQINKTPFSEITKVAVLGLLPSIKLSGLIIAFPLGLFELFKNRKIQTIILGISSILIFVPILIYKYTITGNPLFPGMLNSSYKLPDFLIKSYASMLAAPLSIETFLSNLNLLMMGKFVLIPLLIFLIIKKHKIERVPLLIGLGCFLIYLIMNGGVTSPRFFFSSYFFFIIGILNSIDIKDLPIRKYFIIIILLLGMADSKIDKSISRVAKNLNNLSTKTTHQIVRENIPLTKVWDIIDEKQGLVLSDFYPQQFYAPTNIKLHHYPTQPITSTYDSCDEKVLIETYKYFIIKDLTNSCFSKIQNKLIKLGDYNEFTILKRKPLPF